MDIFTEDRLVAATNLIEVRAAKAIWGRALVRTDINDVELEFLARSFRICVTNEAKYLEKYRTATSVVRGLSHR